MPYSFQAPRVQQSSLSVDTSTVAIGDIASIDLADSKGDDVTAADSPVNKSILVDIQSPADSSKPSMKAAVLTVSAGAGTVASAKSSAHASSSAAADALCQLAAGVRSTATVAGEGSRQRSAGRAGDEVFVRRVMGGSLVQPVEIGLGIAEGGGGGEGEGKKGGRPMMMVDTATNQTLPLSWMPSPGVAGVGRAEEVSFVYMDTDPDSSAAAAPQLNKKRVMKVIQVDNGVLASPPVPAPALPNACPSQSPPSTAAASVTNLPGRCSLSLTPGPNSPPSVEKSDSSCLSPSQSSRLRGKPPSKSQSAALPLSPLVGGPLKTRAGRERKINARYV